ncbi:MAG: hypothetical protein WCP65_03540 [Bacteroidota bacterium]|jgi:hypothetical protein
MNNRTLNILEGIGVGMRILSFTALSIMGKSTPFLALWLINTFDAILLTYCAIVRKNNSYIVLNLFWILVGLIGIYNSMK